MHVKESKERSEWRNKWCYDPSEVGHNLFSLTLFLIFLIVILFEFCSIQGGHVPGLTPLTSALEDQLGVFL